MRALVTGASGLIGAHLVSALVGGGHDVRALVRHAGRSAVPEGVRVTVADLLDATADIDAACVGCDVVFHAAAYFAYGGINPEVLHDTEVVGTERDAALPSHERPHGDGQDPHDEHDPATNE